MSAPAPHYLLFSESRVVNSDTSQERRHQWRFVLESLDDSSRFAATDEEPQAGSRRLDLLAVVRGLEALDQPSRVTLVTPSRYVNRGIRFGLEQWRAEGWKWDWYGSKEPVPHADLWRRLDRALQIHQVDCRVWRFDGPAEPPPAASCRPPAQRCSAAARPTARPGCRAGRGARQATSLGISLRQGLGRRWRAVLRSLAWLLPGGSRPSLPALHSSYSPA